MTVEQFDVVIIGGGPGGYVAAIRSSQLGMKTALVEKAHLGGICLNWGCIPTKALLRSAEVYHLVKHAAQFGIQVKEVTPQLKDIVQRSREVAKQLSTGISHLMKKHKVTVIEGHGRLSGKGKVSIEKQDKQHEEIQANHIILATGARARTLPYLEPDGVQVLTYKQAMVPETLPKTLLVVGSGAIGMEFASFYQTLGVEVTVVEVMDKILPVEDNEISALAKKAFEEKGMRIHTGTTVTRLEKNKGKVTVSLKKKQDEKEEQLTVDRVIVAIGIIANTEGLGLEGTKVIIHKGHIQTNEWLETGEKGVYAIGDVTGGPWLAHKASHEAVICIEKIAGKEHVVPLKREHIPGCTYTMPQVASVGLTEEKAKEAGHKIKIGRFPFMGNGKAIALGEAQGLVKTIFHAETGEFLGAHMIGAEVTELLPAFLIGKTMEATEEEFIHTIFPHPTLSEMLHESVLQAFGKALHI